jgi:hypothetical protein
MNIFSRLITTATLIFSIFLPMSTLAQTSNTCATKIVKEKCRGDFADKNCARRALAQCAFSNSGRSSLQSNRATNRIGSITTGDPETGRNSDTYYCCFENACVEVDLLAVCIDGIKYECTEATLSCSPN